MGLLHAVLLIAVLLNVCRGAVPASASASLVSGARAAARAAGERGGGGGSRGPPTPPSRSPPSSSPPPPPSSSHSSSDSDSVSKDARECLSLVERDCDSSLRALSPNATLSCLGEHFAELRDACTSTLALHATAVAKECFADTLTYCSEWVVDPDALRAGVCLMENYDVISTNCRREIDYSVGLLLPCGKDAGDYCSDRTTAADLKACFEEHADHISDQCKQSVVDFEECQRNSTKSCLPQVSSGSAKGGDGANDNGPSNEDMDNPPPHGPNPLVFLVFLALIGGLVYLLYRGNNRSFKNLTCGRALNILKTEISGLLCSSSTPVVSEAVPPYDQHRAHVRYETTSTHSDDEETTVELSMLNKYPANTSNSV